MSESVRAIDRIAVALAAAEPAADERSALDLGGFEATVADALRLAEVAPTCDRAALLVALERLLRELDRLAARIARRHHAEDQVRAVAAYDEVAQRSGER